MRRVYSATVFGIALAASACSSTNPSSAGDAGTDAGAMAVMPARCTFAVGNGLDDWCPLSGRGDTYLYYCTIQGDPLPPGACRPAGIDQFVDGGAPGAYQCCTIPPR